MPLSFHPSPGTVVICDFATGFRAPEMVKVRPVVVVSPRRRSGQVVTIVPLSTTPPLLPESWHRRLCPASYPPARMAVWAKCDMLTTVALSRLDRVKLRLDGRLSYVTFQVVAEDLDAIRAGILAALGFR